MKISIEQGQFIYSVDYSKQSVDGNKYHPNAKECIEDFLRLLSNEYMKSVISDTLSEGLIAMEYSERGLSALRLLERENKPLPCK